MMTISERVALARQRLRAAGISESEASLDARLLAERVLGWDTAQLIADGVETEPAGFGDRYDALIARRARREPIAYITGRKEFWGLTFAVSPDVLIPRPESEMIVETALDVFPDPRQAFDAIDVCTGSGCIAVALGSERPAARIAATDVSEKALAVAAHNAASNGMQHRITFQRADLLDGVDGLFDLIVANPPYLRGPERQILQPEVRDHEPEVALFAGIDGLAIIRRFVPDAARHLRPGGTLIFEFGFGHDPDVEEIIDAAPELDLITLRRDLQGIARTAVARRR